MKVLKTTGEPERFFARLANAPMSALLLDYDGTLAPFRVDPKEAVPYHGVLERVADIARSGRTQVVFVTGRAVADFAAMLPLDPLPEIWGSHGWERRHANGRIESPTLPATLVDVLSSAARIIEQLPPGTRWERKPYSIAVHWRGVPAALASSLHEQVRQFWAPLVASNDAAMIAAFDGGIELRIGGRTKAAAVHALAQALGDGAPMAFLGDDFTDEDAFLALPQDSLGVLVRDIERPSAASLWLQPPQELLWFLDQWRAAVIRGHERDAAERDVLR